jgi:hypothetical protein
MDGMVDKRNWPKPAAWAITQNASPYSGRFFTERPVSSSLAAPAASLERVASTT